MAGRAQTGFRELLGGFQRSCAHIVARFELYMYFFWIVNGFSGSKVIGIIRQSQGPIIETLVKIQCKIKYHQFQRA